MPNTEATLRSDSSHLEAFIKASGRELIQEVRLEGLKKKKMPSRVSGIEVKNN